MLSRNAQGLYWISRYLERVERVQHLTGLLDAHLDVFPSHERYVESDWRSLLQI